MSGSPWRASDSNSDLLAKYPQVRRKPDRNHLPHVARGCGLYGRFISPDQRLRRLRVVDSHPRPHAQEGHDRQPPRVPRRAAGGQHVVRACAVVAEHLGGPPSDEKPAVVKATTANNKFRHGGTREVDIEREGRAIAGQNKGEAETSSVVTVIKNRPSRSGEDVRTPGLQESNSRNSRHLDNLPRLPPSGPT